jgi:diguanylate cyclase (GGDEF)-like protein
MREAELPVDEPLRLEALQRYAILDTPAEQTFDDLATIASAICGTSMALVSLVDAERQWFKARKGLAAPETARDVAFCAHAILEPTQVMEVRDATQDARFHDNPLVTGDPNIRFYAGAPLVTSDGQAVGTLCVLDPQPRQLEDGQREALAALSRQVVALMELRVAYRELRHHLGEREWYERELDAHRAALREENAALTAQSRTDPLTGLTNRRGFGEALQRALTDDGPIGFAIVDVDHFKSINDGWGHPFGDSVLVAVAGALTQVLGEWGGGSVGRIGGEEFALLLPGRDARAAATIAEMARKAVATLAMQVPVTASLGLTERHTGDGASELYTRADAALYEAKRKGRNRVERA